MKKLYFFGCSVTAGNELYEEEFVPNYKALSFKEARKSREMFDDDEVRNYNLENSFPALTAKKIGYECENLAVEGISNKEIAARAIATFPKKEYTDTIAILQFSTHNRVFVAYNESETSKTVGSFVVHPMADDDRLTKKQNNLLKEYFFEFNDDSWEALTDYMYMYYAADNLRSKGIEVYMIYPDRDVHWTGWQLSDVNNEGKYVNDKDPQFIQNVGDHFYDRIKDYELLDGPVRDIIDFDNFRLPRFHFTKQTHEYIAEEIAKRLK